MTDIAPELLEKVQESFEAETAGLREEIKSGVKSYEEAYDYAIKVGEALSRSFGVNITPEVLPDGMMYYNIADKVVRPMLMTEYNLTSEAAVSAQRSVNKAAGIGIRPLKAEFDAEKAQGIIDRVSSQPFEEIKWILNEPVKTFSKNVVDQTIKKNVEFQGKSGLSPKIRRTALGDACEWCQAVAGTYSYPNVPEDVYRRHANCDCVVEYIDGGKYQDVWSKKTYSKEEHDAAIQERIARAQEQLEAKQKEKDPIRGSAFFKTQDMDLDEYMLAKMEWNKHQEIKVPYPGGREALVEEFDNNLDEEEKKSAIIHKDVDTYHYTAIHLGHNQYKFIDATPIEGTDAEELKELFGDEYEKYFG